MQCGQICYQVDAKAQAEKRPFDHAVITRFTSFTQPLTDSEPWEITDTYAAMQVKEERNELSRLFLIVWSWEKHPLS